MAVRTREELLLDLREAFGDNNSDQVLGVLENVTDTLASMGSEELEKKLADTEKSWKERYDENDRMWRDKYISRFYSSETETLEPQAEGVALNVEEPEYEPTTYEDLFREEK